MLIFILSKQLIHIFWNKNNVLMKNGGCIQNCRPSIILMYNLRCAIWVIEDINKTRTGTWTGMQNESYCLESILHHSQYYCS